MSNRGLTNKVELEVDERLSDAQSFIHLARQRCLRGLSSDAMRGIAYATQELAKAAAVLESIQAEQEVES